MEKLRRKPKSIVPVRARRLPPTVRQLQGVQNVRLKCPLQSDRRDLASRFKTVKYEAALAGQGDAFALEQKLRRSLALEKERAISSAASAPKSEFWFVAKLLPRARLVPPVQAILTPAGAAPPGTPRPPEVQRGPVDHVSEGPAAGARPFVDCCRCLRRKAACVFLSKGVAKARKPAKLSETTSHWRQSQSASSTWARKVGPLDNVAEKGGPTRRQVIVHCTW